MKYRSANENLRKLISKEGSGVASGEEITVSDKVLYSTNGINDFALILVNIKGNFRQKSKPEVKVLPLNLKCLFLK